MSLDSLRAAFMPFAEEVARLVPAGVDARAVAQAASTFEAIRRLRELTHRVLADLTRTSDPPTAAAHLEQCLALEKPLGHPGLRATCLWTSSLLDAGRDRRRADQTSRDALDALAAYPGGPRLVYAWQARLRLPLPLS